MGSIFFNAFKHLLKIIVFDNAETLIIFLMIYLGLFSENQKRVVWEISRFFGKRVFP